MASGATAWAVAELWWVALEIGGRSPYQGHGGRVLDVLFLGFLVPILVALGLRAHPPIMRRDPATVADSLFISVAVLYAFVHLVLVSAVGVAEPSATQRILLGTLSATTTVWAAVLWRAVDHPAWRRAYGAVALVRADVRDATRVRERRGRPPAGPGRMGGCRVVPPLRDPDRCRRPRPVGRDLGVPGLAGRGSGSR